MMVNTPYPYMQASGNQIIEMLEKLVSVFTYVAVILGAMLLVLLVWLCFSELRQSQKLKRAARNPLMNQPQRPARRRPTRHRAFIEDSFI
jgi:hypothetical protein